MFSITLNNKKYSSADPSKVQPGEIVRDCYCDSECIKWGDCCDDHKVFKDKHKKTIILI